MLLLPGVLQGKTRKQLARELGLTEKTVLLWRHRLQAQAETLQPAIVPPDRAAESDEMFQNAGKKGIERFDPSAPRRIANKTGEHLMSNQTLHYDTIAIGGGQAGLPTGYYLKQHGRDFVVLDANERIGDAWRKRWDSLRLFSQLKPRFFRSEFLTAESPAILL